ncbi:hypothetical protein CSOJ01_15355 [Colletotrichum sojae]|uniref:Zn(2)-C6 fungal-type domain-containing protein n=1 Tax=Colletotrichum sojae TaxID=2175907 RepID=A0A8H6IMP0_9PEZI|nr:hypothetical protein CSOJ01_15355 [Colletotrichum sojae]
MFATLDLGSSSHAKPGAGRRGRPKRAQVRCACDWCKLMRIKCDNHRPCSNCQQSGRQCAATGRRTQFRSLADAVTEVESLRNRLGEMETVKKQLEELKANSGAGPGSSSSSSGSASGSGSGASPNPGSTSTTTTTGSSPSSPPQPPPPPSEPPRSDVGFPSPASVRASNRGSPTFTVISPLFMTRMRRFLQETRPPLDLRGLHVSQGHGTSSPSQTSLDSRGASYLLPSQEPHYLALFWQSHYFGYPILSEAEFGREYHSLIANTIPGQPRPPSPLVDVILALCVQIASFSLSSAVADDAGQPWGGATDRPEHSYPSVAGFQYYRRCKEALDRTTESPSVATVQCYVFSIVYLYEAGLIDAAHAMTSRAIMAAVISGLHTEPPPHLSGPEKERARRTWWSLQALDARLSAETSRPPVVASAALALSVCRRPTDTLDYARWLAPHYHHDETCPPWPGFQTQTLRLLETASAVRDAFDARCAEVGGSDVFAHDAAAREDCARRLSEHMTSLGAWARQVPKGYYMPRTTGRPFSTDAGSTPELALSSNILVHCQRQRILLELHYHHACLALYQPFLCLAATAAGTSTPVADGNAAAGLRHAMALTSLLHRALTASEEVLSGVYHVFRWQRAALFGMLAYAYVFPLSPARDAIRACVDRAIAVVEMYRDALPGAAAVAVTARALRKDVTSVVDGFYKGTHWTPTSDAVPVAGRNDNRAVGMDFPALEGDSATPFDFNTMDMGAEFPLTALGDGEGGWDMSGALWMNGDPFMLSNLSPSSRERL